MTVLPAERHSLWAACNELMHCMQSGGDPEILGGGGWWESGAEPLVEVLGAEHLHIWQSDLTAIAHINARRRTQHIKKQMLGKLLLPSYLLLLLAGCC